VLELWVQGKCRRYSGNQYFGGRADRVSQFKLFSPDISRVWFVHGQGIRRAAVVLYLKSPDNTAHGRTRLAKKGENKMAYILFFMKYSG